MNTVTLIFYNNKMFFIIKILLLTTVYLSLKPNQHKSPKEWAFKFTVLLICFYLITVFAIAIILSTNAL